MSESSLALVPVTGTAPLQVLVGGRPVLAWVLDALAGAAAVSRVVVVATEPVGALIGGGLGGAEAAIVASTAGRLARLEAGLSAGGPAPRVLIHDADLPLAGPACLGALLDALAGAPGTVAAAPVKATVKRVRAGVIDGAVPRERLFRIGGPRAFRRESLERALRSGSSPDDEIEAALGCGLRLAIHADEEASFRVLDDEDARLAERFLRRVTDGTR
jgi:2-C-methyl-D-erythritol 4-phosphate cytidylyltransferase